MDLNVLRANAGRAAALLKSLANQDRLLLLCQLVDGEKTVSELESLTGIRQPTLSQQLGVLRNEGLVNTRREGKWIYYSIASIEAMTMLSALHGCFARMMPRRLLPIPRSECEYCLGQLYTGCRTGRRPADWSAASWLVLFNGRIAGISGMLGGLLDRAGDWSWRLAFVLGLLLAPLLWSRLIGRCLPCNWTHHCRACCWPACWWVWGRVWHPAAPADMVCAACPACRRAPCWPR
jgi:ArsR family transcriptional regulator